MASETIYTVEPHRTLHLKGFDGDGDAAALVNASATGFTLKGVFRDMADFCVLTIAIVVGLAAMRARNLSIPAQTGIQ